MQWKLLLLLFCAGCTPDIPETEVLRLLDKSPPGILSLEPAVIARHSEIVKRARNQLGNGNRQQLGNSIGQLAMWHEANSMESLSKYQLAHRLSPTEPRWLYHQARRLDRTQKRGLAVKALIRYDRLFGAYEPAELRLVELLILKGDLDEAARLISRTESQHPRLDVIKAELAIARLDGMSAETILHAVLSRQPDTPRAQRDLGLALRLQGKTKEASRWLRASGAVNKAAYAMGLRDAYYADVVAEDLTSHRYATRGRRLFEDGNYSKAIDLFRKALSLAPERAIYKADLAAALAQSNQDEDAYALLTDASQDPSVRQQAFMSLATLETRKGKIEEAMTFYQSVLNTDPGHAEAHRKLAHLLRQSGRFDAALGHYERASQLDPEVPSDHFWRAVIFLKNNQIQDASTELATALARHKHDYLLHSAQLRLPQSPHPRTEGPDMEALAKATTLLRRKPTVFSLETLAMTLADQGVFQQASTTQAWAIKYLERKKANTLQSRARAKRYLAGQKAELLLSEDDLPSNNVRIPATDLNAILQGRPVVEEEEAR